jgi:hypothetical protein
VGPILGSIDRHRFTVIPGFAEMTVEALQSFE